MSDARWERPSRLVAGRTIALDGTLEQPELDLMARCICDEPMVGELHDMNKLLLGMAEHGYELVKVET